MPVPLTVIVRGAAVPLEAAADAASAIVAPSVTSQTTATLLIRSPASSGATTSPPGKASQDIAWLLPPGAEHRMSMRLRSGDATARGHRRDRGAATGGGLARRSLGSLAANSLYTGDSRSLGRPGRSGRLHGDFVPVLRMAAAAAPGPLSDRRAWATRPRDIRLVVRVVAARDRSAHEPVRDACDL